MMGRLFFAFFLAIGCCLPVAAQDMILLRNADEIRATVAEIGEDEIGYRNFGDEAGPLRRIGKAEVVSITYANGEKEFYTDYVAQPKDAYPYPAVSRSYAVGELFSEGDLSGVVVWVDESGLHGLIMSLQVARLPYGDMGYEMNEAFVSATTGCTHATDGWWNQRRLEQFLAEQGLSWDTYPAFAWCRSLGPGWYLPSIGELECLYAFANDGAPPRNVFQEYRLYKTIWTLCKEYGSEINRYHYWSSTELTPTNALPLSIQWQNIGAAKTMDLAVRAFHRF